MLVPCVVPSSESGIWVALVPAARTLVPHIRFDVSPSSWTRRKSYHQIVSRAVIYQS